MKRYPIIGISIIAVILLILSSLTNVVGFQAVQSSNQKIIKEEVNQKELLFQTIIDIVNNKEIQKIILNSEMRGGMGRFFVPHMKLSLFTPHVLTKTYLNSAYNMGLILSKTISTSKIHSILERYQMSHQGIQKEITAAIEKDATLNGEIMQLSNSKCDCENGNTTRIWNFPILCTLLLPIVYFIFLIWSLSHSIFDTLLLTMLDIGAVLNCFWA